VLEGTPKSARDLSELARLSERDVLEHLEHIRQSARGRGRRLEIEPASCRGCGFIFSRRDRLTRPGRCPSCRATRVEAPRFSLR